MFLLSLYAQFILSLLHFDLLEPVIDQLPLLLVLFLQEVLPHQPYILGAYFRPQLFDDVAVHTEDTAQIADLVLVLDQSFLAQIFVVPHCLIESLLTSELHIQPGDVVLKLLYLAAPLFVFSRELRVLAAKLRVLALVACDLLLQIIDFLAALLNLLLHAEKLPAVARKLLVYRILLHGLLSHLFIKLNLLCRLDVVLLLVIGDLLLHFIILQLNPVHLRNDLVVPALQVRYLFFNLATLLYLLVNLICEVRPRGLQVLYVSLHVGVLLPLLFYGYLDLFVLL